MADVTIALTAAAAGGTTAAPTSITTGNTYKVRNNGRVLLHFVKTGAGNANITITTPNTVGGLAITDQTFVVPATTGNVWAGPFPTSVYNDSNGDLNVTTDEGTGITMEAIQV